MKQEYIKLYSNCMPVKGYKQSFIVDLQRGGASNAIPNSLFEIIDKYPNKTLDKIKKEYNNKYDEIIDDYFQFLLKNEFAFKCSKQELETFPELDLTWKSASIIENAIVDISTLKETTIKKIISELSELRCNALQIRFEKVCSLNDLKKIGLLLENTRILTVEIFIKYSEETTFETLIYLTDKFPRFQRIYIYNSLKNEMSSCSKIIFDKKDINPSKDCGVISSHNFVINIETFTESQCFNTCLNRKISIDSKGYVKNCPSMQNDYGNISNTKLLDIVEKTNFKDYWTVNKDKIDVCQDCEFRHICTDCRAFIRDSKNIYSQPTKCDYNPYIALWKGQKNWISVEQWREENPHWKDKVNI
ncbi:MAG: grasp-with-spasm system SPASM domain peptide maturase [Bacteroidetes bacterium]|nr:grasp-with-spasm system SPASM domain peptide maturase [Bacteroidota bacterium]